MLGRGIPHLMPEVSSRLFTPVNVFLGGSSDSHELRDVGCRMLQIIKTFGVNM